MQMAGMNYIAERASNAPADTESADGSDKREVSTPLLTLLLICCGEH